MPNYPDRPDFAIAVSDDEQSGNAHAWLIITSKLTVHQFYLCDAEDFRDVAKKFNDNILKAGQEMNKRSAGIITVKGLPDGLVQTPKGRRK